MIKTLEAHSETANELYETLMVLMKKSSRKYKLQNRDDKTMSSGAENTQRERPATRSQIPSPMPSRKNKLQNCNDKTMSSGAENTSHRKCKF